MKYLFLPMQPTPNGRMHIGHGGGTYLRADVIARALRRDGHEVLIASGTDAFENWILAAAVQDGLTPEGTCRQYHQGITGDFEALDIHFDAWIDPLSAEHREPYVALHNEFFDLIRSSPTVTREREMVPYGADSGDPMMGTFIAGNCPNCGASCGGSSCTACSEHFQPEQLLDAHSRISDEAIEWRQEENWFIRPRDPAGIVGHLRKTGLAEPHVAVVERYLDRSKGRIRLSGPGKWGVPGSRLVAGHVLANSYFLYALYAARVVTGQDGFGAFAADSKIVTVGIFGTDISSPGLVVPSLYSQALSGQLKPFDFTMVNGMLDLAGRKVSTSQRYGIWLEDILTSTSVTASELRYALSGVPLDEGRANLALETLVSDINRLRRVVRAIIGGLGKEHGDDIEAPFLATQAQYLSPEKADLPRGRRVLDDYGDWIMDGKSASVSTWLALAEPIMPSLVESLRRGDLDVKQIGRGNLDIAEVEGVAHVGRAAEQTK